MTRMEVDELFTFAVIGCVFLLLKWRPSWRPSGTAHGTGRWATTTSDLRTAGMLSGRGLIIGRTECGRLVRTPPTTVHQAIFAPTGGGKGVSYLVPWLLTSTGGSIFVIDPKGENYRLTHAHRRALGQRIIVLDPHHMVTDQTDRINPLDLMSDGPEAGDMARRFAAAMVTRTGMEPDAHWNDRGEDMLAAFITFVARRLAGKERTFNSVRELLTDPDLYASIVELMREGDTVFRRFGGSLASLVEKELASVKSTAERHSNFLDSPAIEGVMGPSTFDLKEFLQGNMTAYCILPPAFLQSQARWMRLVSTTVIRLVGQYGMAPGKDCLLLIDEAGQLGHMEPWEQGLTLLRSYGLKMAFFFQSMGQLRETFRGKEAVLLDNTDQIYFSVNSLQTAEYISKTLGSATITLESGSDSTQRSWQEGGVQQSNGVNVSHTSGRNYAEHERPLLRPEEVLQLPGDLAIGLFRGVRPVLLRRVKWYAEKLKDRPWWLPRFEQLLWWALLAVAVCLMAWATLSEP